MNKKEGRLIKLAAASDLQSNAWQRWGPERPPGSPLAEWAKGKSATDADLSSRIDDWIQHWDEWPEFVEATAKALHNLRKSGVVSLPITDKRYPPQLRGIPYPPLVIYVHGNLSALSTGVGIVGTRDPPKIGRDMTNSLARALAGAGIPVITGMAMGIDQQAARSTIDSGGTLIGVLPGGPLDIIPKRTAPEHEDALSQGCLISEVTGRLPVSRSSFLRRNRIISGLSRVVVVTSARTKGGSINQLEWADRQGRPSIVLKQGVVEDFARLVPPTKIGYHFVSRDALITGTENLWTRPVEPGQTSLW